MFIVGNVCAPSYKYDIYTYWSVYSDAKMSLLPFLMELLAKTWLESPLECRISRGLNK